MDRDVGSVVAFDHDDLEQVGVVGSDQQEARWSVVIGDLVLGDLVVDCVADVRIADAELASGATDIHQRIVLQKCRRECDGSLQPHADRGMQLCAPESGPLAGGRSRRLRWHADGGVCARQIIDPERAFLLARSGRDGSRHCYRPAAPVPYRLTLWGQPWMTIAKAKRAMATARMSTVFIVESSRSDPAPGGETRLRVASRRIDELPGRAYKRNH